MKELDESIDWSPVRRAMQGRVNASSLRELARELGDMSPSGLQNFLDGTTPRQKGPVFVEWFLREGPRWLEVGDTLLGAAIEVVVAHSARDRRDEVRMFLERATTIAPVDS